MKLHVMSDLHCDRWTTSYTQAFFARLDSQPSSEVLLLAGDVGEMTNWTRNIVKELASRYEFVVYTLGNHEFWGSNFALTYKCANGLVDYGTAPNVFVTKGDQKEFAGITWGGEVGWFPAHRRSFNEQWSDFRYIKDGRKNIGIHWKQGIASMKVFPQVFVTHHFPTVESIHPTYAGDPYNKFFHSDLDDKLAKLKASGTTLPELWVHGHTHHGFDYTSKLGFRVYANPYGYLGENTNPDFWDRVAIDI